jgi:nucleoside-diphosphate-sugar epimerase
MNVLVTGADGFLGRHFLAALARRGASVRAMLIPGAPDVPLPGDPQRVFADLLDPAALTMAAHGITHVVHLAARVHMMNDPAPDPQAAFDRINVEGTRLLLEAVAAAGARRFLLMSTVKAMGEEEAGEFDETTPPNPTTPYGHSKLAAEQMMFELAAARGIGATAMRLPMVYGPGAKGNVLRLLDAAAAGKRLPVGGIRNRRSMVYAENVVDASLLALESDSASGEVFLVCDQRPYSTAEVYSAICAAMGKPPLLRSVPLWVLKAAGTAGSVAETLLRRRMPINRDVVTRIAGDLCFSAEKIRKVLGYTPAVDIVEGMRRTVQWYLAGGNSR